MYPPIFISTKEDHSLKIGFEVSKKDEKKENQGVKSWRKKFRFFPAEDPYFPWCLLLFRNR